MRFVSCFKQRKHTLQVPLKHQNAAVFLFLDVFLQSVGYLSLVGVFSKSVLNLSNVPVLGDIKSLLFLTNESSSTAS